jgi:hypothetical protein
MHITFLFGYKHLIAETMRESCAHAQLSKLGVSRVIDITCLIGTRANQYRNGIAMWHKQFKGSVL